MSKALTIGLLGAAGVGIYFLSRKKAAGTVKVIFDSLKIGSSKGFELPALVATFRIQNPSSTPLTLNSITGDLFLNGSRLSTISEFGALDIKPLTEVKADVNIHTGVIDAVLTVIDIIKQKKVASVSLKGNINSNGIMIPIEQTINIGGNKNG